jgi:hypothetical protein
LFVLSTEAEKQILDNPQGQRLCGAGKMRVLLFQKLVVKGPYPKDSKKLTLNINNTALLQSLEKDLDLPSIKRSSLPWSCILEGVKNVYLVSPNVGDSIVTLMPQSEADTQIEKGKQIATRGGYVTAVSGLLESGEATDHRIYIATLQHFYFRYLMGVGDSNLNQVLVRRDTEKQLVAGIDMEEKRSKEGVGNAFQLLFSKPPRKDFRIQLEPYLSKITQFTPLKLSSQVVSDITKYGVSEEDFSKRILTFANLF